MDSHLRFSVRKVFAGVLWAAALVPPVLYVSSLSAPVDTVLWAAQAGRYLWYAAIALGATVVLLLLLYPPFLPFVRMGLSGIKRRLGTDHKPLYDGLYRLQHLETHADHLQVGRAARNLGQLPLALVHLARAFEMDPTHLAGRYELGRVLTEVSRFKDAVTILESVVQEDAQHGYGDALHLLGLAYSHVGAAEQAVSTLRRQQAQFPGNREVHLLLARVLSKSGDKQACIAELLEAARPRQKSERFDHAAQLARARARVALWRGGRFR
ncbi:MAG: tetratricopeptide repeat protein [Planctomycetota bacterium]|jgi:tetratricopeptide (TPR) repeat protein